ARTACRPTRPPVWPQPVHTDATKRHGPVTPTPPARNPTNSAMEPANTSLPCAPTPSHGPPSLLEHVYGREAAAIVARRLAMQARVRRLDALAAEAGRLERGRKRRGQRVPQVGTLEQQLAKVHAGRRPDTMTDAEVLRLLRGLRDRPAALHVLARLLDEAEGRAA